MKILVQRFIDHSRPVLHGGSASAYDYVTRSFIRWCEAAKLKPDDVTTDHIGKWMADELQVEKVSKNTLANKLKVVNIVFRYGVAAGLCKANPVNFALLPRIRTERTIREYFTYAQYQRIQNVFETQNTFNNMGTTRWDDYWGDATAIGWHTGMRISDVAELLWKRINFQEGYIGVWPKKKEALRERLIIPIEPDLFTRLLAMWNTRDQESPYVLPFMRLCYITKRNKMSDAFSSLCVAAGLPDHSFHSLRHGFVSRLLNAGVSAHVVSSMSGLSPAEIMTYAHISQDAQQAALAKSREVIQAGQRDTTAPGVSVSSF